MNVEIIHECPGGSSSCVNVYSVSGRFAGQGQRGKTDSRGGNDTKKEQRNLPGPLRDNGWRGRWRNGPVLSQVQARAGLEKTGFVDDVSQQERVR